MPIQNSFFDIFKCYELSDSVFLPSVADKSYMLVKQVLYEIDKPTEQFLKSLPLTKMDAIKHLAIGHERKDIDILIGNFLELNIIKYSPWFNFAFSYLNVFFLKCFQRLVTYLRKFLCVYLLSAKCYLIKKKLCRLNVSSNIVKGNKFKAILLIIYGGIGDMVLMSPMLQILNQIMPDVLIDVIVKEKYAGFFESCPLINRIIKYPGNRQIYKWLGEPSIFLRSLHKKYDITIGCCEHFGGDCRWFNGKALSYLLDANIRIGSLDMVSRKYPHITKRFLTHSIKERYEHEAVRMLRLLEPIGLTNLEHQAAVWWEGKAEDTLNKFNISTRLNSKYLIGLSPFTGIQKQWPIDRYAMLIKYIQSNFNVTIILLGAKKNLQEAAILRCLTGEDSNIIDLTGKTSINELTSIIGSLFLLISPDSGPAHIAAAHQIPEIVLFGHTNLHRYCPWMNPKSVLVRAKSKKIEDISVRAVCKAVYNIFESNTNRISNLKSN